MLKALPHFVPVYPVAMGQRAGNNMSIGQAAESGGVRECVQRVGGLKALPHLVPVVDWADETQVMNKLGARWCGRGIQVKNTVL